MQNQIAFCRDIQKNRVPPISFIFSHIMGLIFMIFLTVLELTAVVFNLRLLLSCFKDKTKYTFLQRGRMFLVVQWICQVTILVADAVESWKRFASYQLEESCSIFRVLSLSLMFFQACNLMAIITIFYETPVKSGNREFSTRFKIYAVLALGLTGSVTIWWYNCFSSQNLSRMALKAILFASVIFVIVLVSATGNIFIQDTPTDETKPEASVANIFSEKRYVFLVTLLIICLITILSWEPHSESIANNYKPKDFEEQIVLKEVLYSLTETFVVGIFLPVILTGLIDSNDEGKTEMKTILI